MIRLTVLSLWALAVAVFKLNSQYSLIAALFILLCSSFLVLTGYDGFGLRLTTYAYGFFVIGAARYLIEIRNVKK